MRRQLLAFKHAPTVDLRLDDVAMEVCDDRVLVGIGGATAWFSWEEWRDLSRRIEHAMQWIAANTPADVTGTSFDVEA